MAPPGLLSEYLTQRIVDEIGIFRRSDLLALALTHRAFLLPCQRNLLNTVLVDTFKMCHRLYFSLLAKPLLCNYVKVLEVAEDSNARWVTYDYILEVLLDMLPKVEDFSLNNFTRRSYIVGNAEDALDYAEDENKKDESEDKVVGDEIIYRQRWTHLPLATRGAFMRMFSRPTLRKLTIAELSDIPVSFFGTIGRLDQLALLDVTFRNVNGLDVGELFKHRRSFHTLEIAVDNADEQLDAIIAHPRSCFRLVSRLVVRISNVGQQHNADLASKIMKRTASTLTHVVWNEQSIKPFFATCANAIAFDAPNKLEYLTFKMNLDAGGSQTYIEFNWRMFKLIDILLNPAVIKSMRRLKICIAGLDEIEDVALFGEAPCWRPLDEVLAGTNFEVEVIMYTTKAKLIKKNQKWRQILNMNMPFHKRRGLLATSIELEGNEYYSGY